MKKFKETIYTVKHKDFVIEVVQDTGTKRYELFWKSKGMTHPQPLMDGDRWLNFDGRYLLLAVIAANDAAAGMIHDYEKERS